MKNDLWSSQIINWVSKTQRTESQVQILLPLFIFHPSTSFCRSAQIISATSLLCGMSHLRPPPNMTLVCKCRNVNNWRGFSILKLPISPQRERSIFSQGLWKWWVWWVLIKQEHLIPLRLFLEKWQWSQFQSGFQENWFITALITIFSLHNSVWLSDHSGLSLTHYSQECSLGWFQSPKQLVMALNSEPICIFLQQHKSISQIFWEAPSFSHHSQLLFLLNPQIV